MDSNEILDKVKEYADQAHGDQMRKYSDERYIVHPVRVMETVRDYILDVPVLAAALLHDVLEDTDVTSDEMKTFLLTVMNQQEADKTIELVEELTDVYIKANYPRLNRKSRRHKEVERLAAASSDAQTIKYADVMDNAVDIAENDPDFALLYLRESKYLLQQMDRGNTLLRQRSTEVVDDHLKKIFKNANITSL
jgi:guanosine-3',5'-bis(diphosphate) 3'-pyrophosphohydrolase